MSESIGNTALKKDNEDKTSTSVNTQESENKKVKARKIT